MMFSTINMCKMAPATILILIILVNLLDIYLLIRYNFPIDKLLLGISLILAIGVAILLLWIANKTCNNYAWVSWVIIALILISMVDSITLLVDPVKRAKEKEKYELLYSQRVRERSISRTKTTYDPETGLPSKEETKTYNY